MKKDKLETDLELFRDLINRSNDAIFVNDPQTGRFIFVNDKACASLGYDRRELLKMSVMDIETTLPDNFSWQAHVNELRQRGSLIVEGINKRKDGATIPVEANVSYVFLNAREYMVAAVRDITERKRAEKEIAERGVMVQQIMDTASVGIGLVDKSGRFTHANRCTAEMFGCTMEELIGSEYADHVHPSERESSRRNMLALLSSAIPSVSLERRYIRKDGTEFWGHLTCRRFYDAQGSELGLIGVITDITERKEIEEALRESKKRYEAIIESQAEFVVRYLPGGILTFINNTLCRYVGLRREDLLGKSYYPFMHPDDRGSFIRKIEELDKDAPVMVAEARVVLPDGRVAWHRWTHRAIFNDLGELVEYQSSGRDVTELKEAEEMLRRSEERWRLLIDNSAAWIWETDANLRHIYTNAFVTKYLGYLPEQLMRQNSLKLIHPDDHCVVEKIVRDAREHKMGWSNQVLRWRHKDGSWKYIESSGTALFDEGGNFAGLLGVDQDITGRKQIEDELKEYREHLEELVEQRTREITALHEQLRQSQKLEAVGLLAGGIAHDFSNILSTIKGSMYLIHRNLDEGNPMLQYADLVLSSVDRATDLTQSLLAFSRKQTVTLRPWDFNDIIRGAVKLLSQLIGEHIELRVLLTDRNATVMADRSQIEQILLNLATNARDAMPDGGTLTMQTGIVEMDDLFRQEHGYGDSGQYVLLTVSDTGTGMDEKTKEKVFEPFFTTKKLGKGSGLGLAVTYGIVKQHGGFIDVETFPQKGTTFKIYMPVVEKTALAHESPDISFAAGSGETVLLAEDDAAVRGTMAEVLRLSGYTVLEAKDGEDAVRVFKNRKDAVVLVLVDVRMPKKNGREVYEEIKKLSPATKFLFMSGYTDDIISSQRILEEGLDFISKTASPDEILLKIREVLAK